MDQAANEKTKLALRIIQKSKKESGYFRYKNFSMNDLVIQSIIHEFKEKYVYPTSTYRKNVELYRKGKLNWEDLKTATQKMFLDQLAECNHPEIDKFFGLKHLRS